MLERGAKIIGAIVGSITILTAILSLVMYLSGRASAMDLRKTETEVNVLQAEQSNLKDFMDRQDKRSERMEMKLDRMLEHLATHH